MNIVPVGSLVLASVVGIIGITVAINICYISRKIKLEVQTVAMPLFLDCVRSNGGAARAKTLQKERTVVERELGESERERGARARKKDHPMRGLNPRPFD